MTKPPLLSGTSATTSFKPSFTSIEKLTGTSNMQRSSSRQSLERHQSPVASQRSLAPSVTQQASATQPAPLSLAQSRLRNNQSPSTRSFPITSVQGSATKQESPSQPASKPKETKFVSKYTQMLYEQQQKQEAAQATNSSIPQPSPSSFLPTQQTQ